MEGRRAQRQRRIREERIRSIHRAVEAHVPLPSGVRERVARNVLFLCEERVRRRRIHPDLADEVTSEAAFIVLDKLEHGGPVRCIRAFIGGVVDRCARRAYRAEHRWRRLERLEGDPVLHPPEPLESIARRDSFERARARMTASQRATLRMWLDGCTGRESAERQGRTERAIFQERVRIKRILVRAMREAG